MNYIQILYMLLFAFLAYGVYQLLAQLVLKDPLNPKGTKLMKEVRKKNVKEDFWQRHPWIDLLQYVSKYIYLQQDKAKELDVKLSRAGLAYTPYEYMARCYCSAFFGILLAILAALVKVPFFILVGLGLAVLLWVKNKEEVDDKVKKVDDNIRRELPQFVRTIEASLRGERDIIAIIKRYLRIASPDFKRELEILLLDMNTGNIQIALQNFDLKLNMVELSRLVNILIDADRGIDQTTSLTLLASDLALMSRENNKRELALRPGKMKKAMVPATLIAIVSMFYAFVMSTISATQNIF